MAKSGKSYEEILEYYYTGITLSEMEMPETGKPLKGVKLVLDAAQGGEDCDDNVGSLGSREKEINLDIVLKLRDLLSDDGAEVYTTRDRDIGMVLSDRAAISNEKRPDFFLSIGQNSFPNPSASGTELYYFRGDVQGEKLAVLIMDELSSSLRLKNRGVRTADFFLLREVKASSIIIQLLYISCPKDEELLMDEGFRQKAAEAIHRAISKYYEKLRMRL
jgi:N-acetylmuramoyl-L-alanine amidase